MQLATNPSGQRTPLRKRTPKSYSSRESPRQWWKIRRSLEESYEEKRWDRGRIGGETNAILNRRAAAVWSVGCGPENGSRKLAGGGIFFGWVSRHTQSSCCPRKKVPLNLKARIEERGKTFGPSRPFLGFAAEISPPPTPHAAAAVNSYRRRRRPKRCRKKWMEPRTPTPHKGRKG